MATEEAFLWKKYRISLKRRHGYYLFQGGNWCGVNLGQHLFFSAHNVGMPTLLSECSTHVNTLYTCMHTHGCAISAESQQHVS